MIEVDAIPHALRQRPQWLIWRFEPNKKFPDKKPRKMPYYTNGKRRGGTQGNDEDRASLRTFDDALMAAVAGGFNGVGFAFLPDDGLIGIDIDKCIDAEGVMTARAAAIIESCASYTEYSPSRTGVHIIVAGHTETFKSDDVGVEVFCSSQFFTFTGAAFPGTPCAVMPISDAVLGRLRVTVKGKRQAPRSAAPPATTSERDERARLESALACISADCDYRTWYRVGMAIYSALGDTGFAVWDYWSSKGDKYQGTDDLKTHWKSFGSRGNAINAATVFHLATQAGWRPPRQDRAANIVPMIKATPRPESPPSPPVEDEMPGVPPEGENQQPEHERPAVPAEEQPPTQEQEQPAVPAGKAEKEKPLRPSAKEAYEAENPPDDAAAGEGGGASTKGKKKVVRGQSFWDAIDHLLDHFVLLYGTDTAWDEVNRIQIKVNAIRLAYGSDAVKFWLGNSSRRMINAKCMVFDPTESVSLDTHVNLFNGFDVKPKKGGCDKIKDLLLHLCDGNEELNSWITRWLAYQLQHPGAKMATSIIMHGDEGSGKNLFFEKVIRQIFGEYGGVIGNAQIESQFNEWASKKLFLVCDEVVTRNELKQLKGKLKSMISGEEIPINPKNLPERAEANHINFVFLSNELQPLALDKTDRRYLVVWTPPKRDLAYYLDVATEIESGGKEAYYHYLLHEVDCGDMNAHTKPIDTLAKRKLISLGLSAPERFYREWSAEALPLPFVCCSAMQLYAAFQRWAHLNGERYPPTQTEFGGKVERMAAGEITRRIVKYGLGHSVKQRTVYMVGDLPEGKKLNEWVEEGSTLFESYLKKFRHVYDQSEQG